MCAHVHVLMCKRECARPNLFRVLSTWRNMDVRVSCLTRSDSHSPMYLRLVCIGGAQSNHKMAQRLHKQRILHPPAEELRDGDHAEAEHRLHLFLIELLRGTTDSIACAEPKHSRRTNGTESEGKGNDA